jgi:5'-3' exonuclease
MFSSITKVTKNVQVDHIVFALEGHSWRKEVYEPYKKPRAEERQARSEEQVEEDELYWETFNELTKYLKEHTNCSVIRSPNAEADDVIARWIHLHPNDEHIILSSDTDFYQLLNNNVKQYNGITKELITVDGVYGDNGQPIIDNKTREHKVIGDPSWILFEKCIRGDPTDNVFSAYPGARKKGTKNKIGLLDAFGDRDKKGFAWNNLMLQRWTDHDGNEHRVLDDYERNRLLIDLTAQPREVIEMVDDDIENVLSVDIYSRKPANQIGFYFMKFCSRFDLGRLSEHPQDTINWIIKPYPGEIEHLRENKLCQPLKQKQL